MVVMVVVKVMGGAAGASHVKESLTMPVAGSTVRLSVSTAMTCGVFSFQGPYFRQLLVETSSHE
jgi:vacuolar-type H+-ATPase subunit B/Vma2